MLHILTEDEIMSDISSISVQTSSESSTRTFSFHCYIACWCYRLFSAIVHSSSNDTTVMQWVIYLMESPLSLISYEPFKGLFSIMSGTQVQYTWTKTGWVWLWELSALDNWRASSDSQDGPGLEILLVHPFGLAQFEDLSVAQILQTTFKLIQRVRLDRESTSDLFLHHLHHL